MTDWEKDKAWSDRFLPEIKAILGMHLIGEPALEEDQQRNTDLIVLKLDNVRVACRVRKAFYVIGYGDEFTVRSGRPCGVKTELQKIVEGWGDYMFYAFADDDERRLTKWTLARLNVFRLWFNRRLSVLAPGEMPGEQQQNRDKSSSFHAFRWCDIPADFIVATGDNGLDLDAVPC